MQRGSGQMRPWQRASGLTGRKEASTIGVWYYHRGQWLHEQKRVRAHNSVSLSVCVCVAHWALSIVCCVALCCDVLWRVALCCIVFCCVVLCCVALSA